jgi:hypothetical protein
MRSNFVRVTLALALLAFFPALALAQKEIVIWHGYRGGEKAAFRQDQGHHPRRAL